MEEILLCVGCFVGIFIGFLWGAGSAWSTQQDQAVAHGCAAYHLEGKTAVFKWNDEKGE